MATVYTASIWPGKGGSIPTELASLLLKLEASIGKPTWIAIQRHPGHPLGIIDEPLRHALFIRRKELRDCNGSALVIDSPGGQAEPAYQIARLFQRHCGGFTAIIPSYAKSAATLLTLGAREIWLGSDAELGPLDVQITDFEAETAGSALDEIQALERLNAAALDQIDQTMFLLLNRTAKKVDVILPLVLNYVNGMMAPLVGKIDTLHYSSRARVLKVAEDYATRLLVPRFDPITAARIARRLVNNYPEHGFVIDRDELSHPDFSGLVNANEPEEDIQQLIDDIELCLAATPPEMLVIGRIQEVAEEAPESVDEGTPEIAKRARKRAEAVRRNNGKQSEGASAGGEKRPPEAALQRGSAREGFLAGSAE